MWVMSRAITLVWTRLSGGRIGPLPIRNTSRMWERGLKYPHFSSCSPIYLLLYYNFVKLEILKNKSWDKQDQARGKIFNLRTLKLRDPIWGKKIKQTYTSNFASVCKFSPTRVLLRNRDKSGWDGI